MTRHDDAPGVAPSTGPPLIEAEDWCDGCEGWRPWDPSTGPPLIEAEDLDQAVRVWHWVTLQRGRLSSRRRTSGVASRAEPHQSPSTGPPLIEAEDVAGPGGAQRRPRGPSTGPPLIEAEDPLADAKEVPPMLPFNGAASHRGGGPTSASGAAVDSPPFNGAASHRGGGPTNVPSAPSAGDVLQRGRLSSRRRTSRCSRRRWRPAAFNGAASHRGGGPPAAGPVDGWIGVLQRGRLSSRRRTPAVPH